MTDTFYVCFLFDFSRHELCKRSNNFDMGSISNIGDLITLQVTNRRREGGGEGEGEGVGWCEARDLN